MAEGARQHLAEVARNDIQQIADLASDALSEIRLAPSPDHLDFGQVPRGSPPRKQSVTMHGPPLARHCVAQPKQSWLRVDPTRDGLEVHVDTAAEGRLSGDIVLKGVADESVIHIEAVVDPAHEPGLHTEPEPGTSNGRTGPARGSDGKRDTVVVEPSRIRPPETPPLSSPSRRAPTLAGAALALAVTAVVTLVLAIQAAAVAVMERSDEGVYGNVEDNIREHGALMPLTVCLITGAVALVVSAFARHDLGARRERYTRQAASGTHTLTSIAKGLAIPALILAALACIAYLVGSPHW